MGTEENERLFEAAKEGDIPAIQAALDSGAKLTAKWAGMTPLALAARGGKAKALVYLIGQGAKVDDWAIHVASVSAGSHEGIVKYLVLSRLKQVKPITKGLPAEDAKLLRAAYGGKVKALQKALDAGANVNASDNQDNAALRWATRWGHGQAVAALLDAGADVNLGNDSGWTALTEAVMGGHEELVEALIAKGANVNARINGDVSVLSIAKDMVLFSDDSAKAERIIAFLASNGAD